MRAPGTVIEPRRGTPRPVVLATAALAIAVLASAAIAGAVLARVALAQTPLPPRADRSIYDVAGVIDPADESAMEAVNRELHEKTGVGIVVLTVPALVDETIDELAVRLGQTWGIGSEGRDRGLVIAFARDDRRIFVATGYGTEEYLPDGRVGALIDDRAMPHLRVNRFSTGLAQLDVALARAAAQHHGVPLTGAIAPRAARPEPRPLSPFQLALGVLAMIALAYLAIRHPRLFFMLLLTMGRGGGHRGGSGFGGGGGGFGGSGGGFGGGGAGRGF